MNSRSWRILHIFLFHAAKEIDIILETILEIESFQEYEYVWMGIRQTCFIPDSETGTLRTHPHFLIKSSSITRCCRFLQIHYRKFPWNSLQIISQSIQLRKTFSWNTLLIFLSVCYTQITISIDFWWFSHSLIQMKPPIFCIPFFRCQLYALLAFQLLTPQHVYHNRLLVNFIDDLTR